MSHFREIFYNSLVEPPNEDIISDVRYRLAIEFIESNLREGRRYNLLDVGFGFIAFLEYMTEAHSNMYGFGCDVAPLRMAHAAGRERLDLKTVDFNDCMNAYPSSFFDFIYAGEVIEHLENPDNFVVESAKYLKSGGYFIITTPNLAAWYERLLLLFGMEPLMAEVSYECRTFGKKPLYRLTGKTPEAPVGHMRLYTSAALKELCEYHGLEFVSHVGYYTYDFFLNRWISKMYNNLAQGIFMVMRKM